MGFESGSISFSRFAVVGQSPKAPDEEMLLKLAENGLKPTEAGVPEDVEWGWVGPKHIFDNTFDFDRCVFNECIHFGLRIDTNKVPSEVKNAFLLMEEDAVAASNPSGFISKQQKRSVRDSIGRKLNDELRSGKYRRSKMISLLWDVPNAVLYAPNSQSVREKLQELFNRTFNLDLEPLTAGSLALRTMEKRGKRRDYEDWMPTRFAKSSEDPDKPAEYPWTTKGDGAKDFLGNEFLLWLWNTAQENQGSVDVANGNVSVVFDRSLDLDCIYGESGKDSLRGTGPTRMPEALDALRTGKVPRKAGLMIESSGNAFNLNFNSEALSIGSLKLPEIEEAETPRSLFEQRIQLLQDFNQIMDSLYETFLKDRSAGWETKATHIRKWISSTSKAITPVMMSVPAGV